MPFFFRVVIICLFSLGTNVWAESKSLSLYYLDTLSKPIVSYYQSLGYQLNRYNINDLPTCSQEKMIAVGNQALRYVQAACPQQSVLGLFTVPIDEQVGQSLGLSTTSGLYDNLKLASRYFNRIGVVYSEQLEEAAIKQLEIEQPQIQIFKQKVINQAQVVKAIGRLFSDVDVIVLGVNPAFFDAQVLRTAAKISIKYRKPLVGGRSQAMLKKGIALGVYADPYQILNQSNAWLQNPNVDFKLIYHVKNNASLMKYFGLAEE